MSRRLECGRALAGRRVQPKVSVLRINQGGLVLKAGAKSKNDMFTEALLHMTLQCEDVLRNKKKINS